ncbi:contractile injection system protein, VgrG/Pvc8 family, partial [Hafnia paralvei]
MPMDTGLYFSCQVGSLPLDTFDVTEFHLQEGLSELFTLSLTVVSHSDDIDMQSQLLQTAVLTITSDGDPLRIITGVVSSAEQGDSGFRRTFYYLTVRPAMWVMTLDQDSRIYHQKAVPDLLA